MNFHKIKTYRFTVVAAACVFGLAAFLLHLPPSLCAGRRGGRYDDEQLKLGLKFADAGKTSEALEILKDATEDNPTAARFMALGIVHIQRGEYDASYENLRKALDMDPNLPPAVYTLAMLYEKKGMHADALAEWRKFLTIARKKEFRDIAERHIEQLEMHLGIKR